MNTDTQDRFIQTLTASLIDVPPSRRKTREWLFASEPDDRSARLDALAGRSRAEKRKLLDRLKERAAPINLKVIPVETCLEAGQAIAQLVRDKSPEWGTTKQVVAWDHPLIRQLNLDAALSEQPAPLVYTPQEGTRAPSAEQRQSLRQEVIKSFIGITSADYCVVESATLAMKTRPSQPRSVSLVPAIHVAVIELDQLVENLGELYFRLQWDPKEQAEGLTNCLTFISGPSKTGDIELVMVHGAHGPRELHLYVITGPMDAS
ncbi:MAG: lactate utilization protein [Pseudomonadota bacterium]